jgi:hypothetical protein
MQSKLTIVCRTGPIFGAESAMHGETSNSVRYTRRGQADSTAIQTVAVVKSDIGMRTAFLVLFVLSSLSLPIHHVHFRPVGLIGYAFVTMPVSFA